MSLSKKQIKEIWLNTNKNKEPVQFSNDEFPTQKYDRFGVLMQWSEYGNEHSGVGWNIHHIDKNRNNNNLNNLEALNFRSHRNIHNK